MKIDANNARAYIEHCNRLAFLTAKSGEEVYTTLRRIEKKGNRLALDYCNGHIGIDKYESECDKLRARVEAIFPELPIYLNGDPRGYFLKVIESHANLFPVRDWGGYGILAPEF